MARGKLIEIDKADLQAAIDKIELSRNPPKTRNELWKAVAVELKISVSTAIKKAKEHGISIRTEKGRRGAVKGKPLPKNWKRGKRKQRRFTVGAEKSIRKKFAELGEKTVNAICAGKLRAAVRGICFDCSGYNKLEVALCPIRDCPLWPHRPWTRDSTETGLPVNSDSPSVVRQIDGCDSPESDQESTETSPQMLGDSDDKI